MLQDLPKAPDCLQDKIDYTEHYRNNLDIIIDNQVRKILSLNYNEQIPLAGEIENQGKYEILNFVYNNLIDNGGARALDVFNHEFRLNKDLGDFTLRRVIPIIIAIKEQRPKIDIADALLYSNLRFCLLTLESNKRQYVLVDFPTDIFKFLVENKYDQSLIEHLMYHDIEIKYDAVTIFKKVLKIGKGFDTKQKLIDTGTKQNSLNVLEYVISKYNPENHITELRAISSEYSSKAREMLNIIRHKAYGIHELTLFNRISNGMNFEDALKLGIQEKEKYNYINELSYLTPDIPNTHEKIGLILREVFYRVIREEISKGV